MAEARLHRRRLGGAMRQAGVIAAGGLYALDHHIERLADDHDRAPWEEEPTALREIAGPAIRQCCGGGHSRRRSASFQTWELGFARGPLPPALCLLSRSRARVLAVV